MIFLSLVLVPIIVFPLVFKLSSAAISFLEICDWTVVLLFVIEYLSKLYLAEDRWRHFKSPWHIVDLAIVTLPFLELVPVLGLGVAGSSSLLLRLLRLPRALAVSGRALAGRRVSVVAPTAQIAAQLETQICQVDFDTKASCALSWDDLQAHVSDGAHEEWIDIFDVSEDGISKLSSILGIPEPHFKSELVDEIYPHIDYVQQASFIFLQSGKIRYPELGNRYLTISRLGVIVICSGTKIITVSKHGMGLSKALLASSVPLKRENGLVVAVLYGILEHMLDQYKVILSEIEMEVIKIGGAPRSKLPRDFLERIYRMDKEVSRLVSNLVHFKELLGIVVSKRVPLQGFSERSEEAFNVLRDAASYLNEIADDLRGNLRSTIDLYINQTSFETNRILKILAVITAISVIPTAVGGLLGANLLDTPYTVYLWQAVFCIGIAATLAVYVFYKLGWLKT
jgi:Mg2+ and Co2+ transporter CorA